ALDPAEPRFVPRGSRVEHVRKHEAVIRRAEIADDLQNRPLDFFDLRRGSMWKGKIGSAVIPNNTEHWKIDQLIIDHLGACHPPDFFGDRVFTNGRDADQVDNSVVEFHPGLSLLPKCEISQCQSSSSSVSLKLGANVSSTDSA